MRIELGQHLDGDTRILSRTKHRVNRRQIFFKTDIHNAAAHRDDLTEIGGTGFVVQRCI